MEGVSANARELGDVDVVDDDNDDKRGTDVKIDR